MRTSKLLILGTALLVLALAAQAEEGDAPDPAVAGAEAVASPEQAPEPAAETAEAAPEEAGEAVAAETASAEVGPADAASDVVDADGAPAGGEVAEDAQAPADEAMVAAESQAPADEAVVAAESQAPAGQAMPAPVADASGIELGAIGYDEQGRPGRIHVVRKGDTLWFISDAYLGTPWVWPSIWKDNQDIENPHLIYPGDHIWITPSEMRKVTREEAEALMAGTPGDDELTEPADQGLADVLIPGPAEKLVPAEQPRVRISDRERVGLVSAEVVEGAASILANTAPRLMISQADRVFISLGAGEVAEGDQFTVFRVGAKVFDPETGRMLGYHVEFLGWLEVEEVDVESSLASVHESSSEMEKGDKLMARREPIREIPLAASPTGVDGQISFTPDSRFEMGMMDYVYLNRGTLDGVEVGSPLHVYRKGFRAEDTVSGSMRQVPDRVIADLVVIRSEPEASVAFVRHTEEEITRGDHFRGAE